MLSMRMGVVTKTYYDRYKRVLRNVVKLAKRMDNNNYIHRSKNKAKAAWNLTKRITETNRKVSFDPQALKKKAEGTLTILNKINEFFLGVSPSENGTACAADRVIPVGNSMFLRPVLRQEIIDTIKSLNDSHSVGSDEIPVVLIKGIAELNADSLEYVVNLMFRTKTFPDALKEVIIKSIHKKVHKSDMGNYRYRLQIWTFLRKENVMTPIEHGI